MSEYLKEIALYLEAVRRTRGWTQQQMGNAAGTSHSTINRALQGKNKVHFEKLMALAEASGVPLPERLRGAAIAAQQPTVPASRDIRQAAAELLEKLPESERESWLREMLRKAV